MKIKEVIEKILAYHPHLEGYRGCDDYKSGDPEMECTGVVTALTPNIAVIRKAIELNANLIVVHEPTYYTSQDGPGWFEDFDNEIYVEKHKLLEQHKICIWRDQVNYLMEIKKFYLHAFIILKVVNFVKHVP
ncbi:MAG: Nif3-like dinuclear metal center hexameric protein [Erysipelotrichaceae bacterium]|nr:Nif3-like dinuclear metal center hexameric protein [Erysipelotrichaceae bacterium]